MHRWSFALATFVTFALSFAPGTTALAANRFARSLTFGGGLYAAASTYGVIYAFSNGVDGGQPTGKLIKDAAGSLYGTTMDGGLGKVGTVFKLTPPAPGRTAWTETVLHSFSATGADGCKPLAALLAYGGALYGTTSGCAGAGYGTVFRLTPPAPGRTAWTLSVLHTFAGSPDGASPEAPLIEYGGALYGTTYSGGMSPPACDSGCGTVFRLTPPAPGKTTWTESVLHAFAYADGVDPQAALIVDASGTFYGTTEFGGSRGSGNVFTLTPPAAGQTNWRLTELYAFADNTGSPGFPTAPVLAFHGALYGTTTSGGAKLSGTIFKLSPPVGKEIHWKESTLYSFLGLAGNDGEAPGELSVDANGNFYGTTIGGGTRGYGIVFKLTPPASGSTVWRESIAHAFTGVGGDGYPDGGLIEYSLGTFYGTTSGQVPFGGTAFKIKI